MFMIKFIYNILENNDSIFKVKCYFVSLICKSCCGS